MREREREGGREQLHGRICMISAFFVRRGGKALPEGEVR